MIPAGADSRVSVTAERPTMATNITHTLTIEGQTCDASAMV